MGRGLPGLAVLVLIAGGCSSDTGAPAGLGDVCGADIPCEAGGVCFEFVCRAACNFNRDCDVLEEHCEGGICVPGSMIQCGNSSVEPGEECDDGNRFTGDGCAADCLVEGGFSCSGDPSVCVPLCPNGALDPGEECDDANSMTGDGCDDNCDTEVGFACAGEPSMCASTCSNGVIDALEICDDGDLINGDGCSDNCTVEAGWTCTTVAPITCTPICGDGMQLGSEGCDDGDQNNNDDCPDGPGGTCQPAACNDGFVNQDNMAEACDDANTMILDGCNMCQLEANWACSGDPSACQCAMGFQDNDADGTCLDSCVGLGWVGCGGNGTCRDTSGVAFCLCDTGFQDNDSDGTCTPDCSGITCGGFGTCDDMSGSPVCSCMMGYEDIDGDLVCDPDCNTTGCQNGGTCSAGDCICPPAFIGEECQICRIYVDVDATGTPDGHSWATAHTGVRAALVDAGQGFIISGGPCEVWVAEGMYTPWMSTQSNRYNMPMNAHLYGGFDGTETTLMARDPVAHLTILDGRDDGMGGTPRVERLVVAEDDNIIDGFTFQEAGRSNGPRGAGVDISADNNVSIRNCIFRGLQARDGAAISLQGGMGFSIEDSRFEYNQVTDEGGAIFIDSAMNVSILRSAFVGNSAQNSGGVIRGRFTQITIDESQFLNNWANDEGGVIWMDTGGSNSVVIDRSTFAANIAGFGGGGQADGGVMSVRDGSVTIRDSVFSGNRAVDDGGVLDMRGDQLIIERTFITGNRGGNGGGAIHVNASFAGAPQNLLTNILFAGNSALSTALHYFQMDGSVRASHLTLDNVDRSLPGIELDGTNGAEIYNSSLVRVGSGEGVNSSAGFVNVYYCLEPTNNDFCGGSCNDSNMVTGAPGFEPPGGGGGLLDDVVYDPVTETTILTDNSAMFTPGALVGQFVGVDVGTEYIFPIVANSATELSILGDMTRPQLQSLQLQPGGNYQILNYALTAMGNATDAGTAMTAPPDDILGVARDMSPDIGCYEYVP